ncbi:MAG: hypothetical protein GY870_08325 [archaeon]|nr:hypothetical protein [archaeon]
MTEQNFDRSIFYAYLNDGLDLVLFSVGFLIPFFGDVYESIIGGLFDVVLLIILLKTVNSYKNKNKKIYVIMVFLIELIDLTDFFTLGITDFLGWVEIFPFWILISKWLNSNSEFKKQDVASNNNIVENLKENVICSSCNTENYHKNTICETCGVLLIDKQDKRDDKIKEIKKVKKVKK